MNKKGKIIRWVGMGISLPAFLYAITGFFFYSWLSAAEPERWPAEKAALWAFSSLAIGVLLFGVFIYCIVSLIKEANRRYKEEQMQHNKSLKSGDA